MTLTIPNTISNGTAGDASEIEANFTAIEAYVNGSTVNPDGSTAMTGALTLPAVDPAADNEAARKLYVDYHTPAGVMVEYGAAVAPAGWLLCNGAAVSRTTYARLFAALGVNWGAGNGSTTFNVPDRRSRVGVGWGTTYPTMGATGGQTTVQAHTHVIDSNTVDRVTRLGSNTAGSYIAGGDTDGDGTVDGIAAYSTKMVMSFETDHTHTAQSAGAGVDNMNPYVVVNHIIKV